MYTPNFVMVKTRKSLDGRDITNEWNALMFNQKKQEIAFKEKTLNFIGLCVGAGLYGLIAVLANRKH